MKTFVLIKLTLVVAVIYGWIANIVKLVTHAGPVAEWTAMEIARVIGILDAPLGVVLGYC